MGGFLFTADFVMPIQKEELEKILQKNFPQAKIEIVDLVGDKDHYSLHIVDKVFYGKTRIEQHKLVNNSLKEILGDSLHAMQLKTSFE